MNTPKNTYNKTCINPNCKKEFTCHHDNQKYCFKRCKRNSEKDKKRKARLETIRKRIDMIKTKVIFESFIKEGRSNVSLEDLKKKGVDPNNYICRVECRHGDIIYIYDGYSLHKISQSEFLINKLNNETESQHF